MHGLTSIMFLPSLLEVISPHLRPYLLTSHFRILVAYWVSRGRPDLYVAETLMAATPYPRAPPVSSPPSKTAVRRALDENRHNKGHDPEDPHSSSGGSSSSQNVANYGFVESPATPKAQHAQPFPAPGEADAFEDDGSNPWMRVLASAVDHDDEHATKVVRSLYYAATHFGTSEKGIFTSSLPGTELMDGSIFIRGASFLVSLEPSVGPARSRGPCSRACSRRPHPRLGRLGARGRVGQPRHLGPLGARLPVDVGRLGAPARRDVAALRRPQGQGPRGGRLLAQLAECVLLALAQRDHHRW